MPSIDRTTIISGPALIVFAGSSFWSKGDVMLKPVNKRFDIPTSHFGKVDERFSDRRIEVTFEPAGQFTTALAAVLWPYGATQVGASIYGATDRILQVHGRDGIKFAVNNASLTQMPNIRMGVDKTTIGAVKFTGLLAKSTDPTNAAAYFTSSSVAYPGDTGFVLTNIWTQAPSAVWGASAPWSAFMTEGGWDVSFNLKLAEQAVDGLGTVDMTFQQLDISVKAIPVGPTVAQVMTSLKTNQALGTSLASADNLVLSGTGTGSPTFTLNKAALVDAEFKYGNEAKRIGVCEWIPTRTITAGTPDPLFTIAQSA